MKTCQYCFTELPDEAFRSYRDKPNKFCTACLEKLGSSKDRRLRHQEATKDKVCPQCHRSEPEAQFRLYRGKINKYCNLCNERSTEFKKRNWTRTLKKRHEWLETSAGKKYRLESAKKSWRKQKYGISNEIFESLKSSQDSKCAICQEIQTELCVDHDHETGMVRALLCRRCNSGIGFFDDSPEKFQRAINYIQHFKTWSYKLTA